MSICVVDGGPCQCQPSEGCPCPGVAALHAKDSIRTREHNLLVAENRSQAAEIAALRAEVAGLREALLQVARMAEALKKDCGMDPESPQAVRNGQYMNISYFARAALAARKGEA